MTVAVLSSIAGAAIFVGQEEGPDITATAAIVVDAGSGRVLWGKNPDSGRYPASTTKILTGLLLLEHTDPTDLIVAPADTKTVRGSSLHMEPGESVTAGEALYALMLRSANDTAHAIAVHIAGSDEAFAAQMNSRAKELGCEGSFFRTPHGLNDDYHVTTAHDLARIAVAAVREQEFTRVVATQEHWITRSTNQKDLLLQNRNVMLSEDPTNQGIKTGYTNPAGQCFVGLHENEGRKVVTVILQSSDWRADQSALSTWVRSTFSFKTLAERGSPTAQVPVADGEADSVGVSVSDRLEGFVSAADTAGMRFVPNKALAAPVETGQALGEGTVVLPDGTRFPVSLVAEGSVKRKFSAGEVLRNPVALAVIGTSILLTQWMRRRARRPRARSGPRPR